MEDKRISGFSKLSKRGKLKWIAENFFKDPEAVARELKSYWYVNEQQQKVMDGFSENTISNFHLPFGVAPNLVINGKTYCVPMVIEESSVVAAASSAAKFWMERGGFKAEVLSKVKIGQVHFYWKGRNSEKLKACFKKIVPQLKKEVKDLTANMEKRGGGILDINLKDFTEVEEKYYQIEVKFNTCDSMGANFINSVLEKIATVFIKLIKEEKSFNALEKEVDVIMSILSNYTPECLVRASVECSIEELGGIGELTAEAFAHRFYKAVKIAHIDPYRATTHNKGIFNGVDAVVLATGNDFRAIEACGHTYAARDGQYKSLSFCEIKTGVFQFWLDLPLSVGTVGGLTKIHPIAKRSLELLGNPNADELMQIIACTGLAQNFAAIRSLTTTGIQKGHMKMHLLNILNHLEASEKEINLTLVHFENKPVSFSAVRDFLEGLRPKKDKVLVARTNK